jgi:transportin-1
LLVLYDAFSTLSETAGHALNQPQYINSFMPPLLAKWSQVPDDDYDLFPILECMSSLSIALGPGFLPYVEPIWQRAIHIIKNTIIATQVQLIFDI